MNLESIIKPSDLVNERSAFTQAKEISNRLPPISRQCEAIAVIPVYREFKGGRITKLLEELQAQDVGSRRFETILVVNNSALSTLQNHPDSAGYEDNLEFLRYINDQKALGLLPNVHVLDCTDGEIPGRYMGLVRGLGQLVAEDRLDRTEQGENGIIVQLDADVSVDRDFVAKLLAAYQQPEVGSATIGRIPLPIDFPSDDYYLFYAERFARTVVSYFRGGVEISGDGPTLSLRAAYHKLPEVRRYMRHWENEDFELAEALRQTGRMYLLAEPRVYKGDRMRPDGFDSANREAWINMHETWTTSINLIRYTTGEVVSKGLFEEIPYNEFWLLVADILKTKKPRAGQEFQRHLAEEEKIGRRTLDWDSLDIAKRDHGLYLYALSRLLMGESQMLDLSEKVSFSERFTKLLALEINHPSATPT